jgi:hypothetical protein
MSTEEKKQHSVSETGNDVTVSNLKKLNRAIVQIGSSYQPSAIDIQVASLDTKETEADYAMSDWRTKLSDHTDAINQRQFLYEIIPSYCVRIVAEVEGLGADEKIIADAHSIVRKIRGKRAKELPPVPAKAPDAGAELAKIVKHSVSQLGFDNRKGNFEQLVKLLFVIPVYQPNEPDMTITHLNSFLTDLNDVNKLVNTKTKALSKARLYRNKVLYDDKTGVVVLGNRSKKYIKGAFGLYSDEYALVKDIHFIKNHK